MKLNFASLLQLENDCRNAQNIKELDFIIVNNTSKLIDYEKAILLYSNNNSKYKIQTISDIAVVDRNIPYSQFMESLANGIKKNINPQEPFFVDLQKELLEEEDIKEYRPYKVAWIPLTMEKDNIKIDAILLLLRKKIFEDKEKLILEHISNSFSYFILSQKNLESKSFFNRIKSIGYFKYMIIFLVLIMFIPIQMNLLAPLTVIPKEPQIVTAPIDGVIEKVFIKPNQMINANEKLIKFDSTEIENRYFIAKKSLELSKTTLYAIKQNSFYNKDSKNKISQLKAEVKLKQSQLEFEKQVLEKSVIYSANNGEVIIDNPSALIGKYVSTGEKIFRIANPKHIELQIMVPVEDMIFIQKGYKIKLFLDNNPIKSYSGTVEYISYNPTVSNQNVLAYEVIGSFDDKNNIPNIGLKGTAKIYAGETTLFFYLFRKPITKLRQVIGW
jgi:multidrug resistance efflux pump